MQESLLSFIATAKHSFATHGQTLRKETTAYEIRRASCAAEIIQHIEYLFQQARMTQNLLRPTSIAIALVGDHSDLSLDLSISHSQLDAVVALRVEFNSTFQRSPKTRRMYANRWSALVADQIDCNGGRP